jgi:hypothetical protein
MTVTAMNNTYINALLADASYVNLDNLTELQINANLAARLTQPLADFITANFEVLNQTGVNSLLATDGFSATAWYGRAGTEYAGKTYISTRGTEPGIDFIDDGQLALTGVAYDQIASMVNWWLRETTPVGQLAKQIKVLTLPIPMAPDAQHFVEGTSIYGTGALQNVSFIDSINGHSLGGYLATAFGRLFGNQWTVAGISTFNSAGFSSIATPNINYEFSTILGIIGNSLGYSGFLNNQTNYFGENGIEVTTNAWQPIGFNQIGPRVALYQEGDLNQIAGPVSDPFSNHYMFKITDMLALGDAIAKLDNNFTISSLNNLVMNASNHMDASYEELLDGLRKTILGGEITGTPTGDTSSTIAGSSRVVYHQNLKNLQNSSVYQALIGKVTITAPPTSATEARSDLGLFLSLYYLTPFALKTDGSIAADAQLTIANPDLATQFKEDKLLTSKEIADGKANFSDMYLADRAAMLSWVNKRNATDEGLVLSTTGTIQAFEDKDSSTVLLVGEGEIFNRNQYVFGSDTGNTIDDTLSGGDKATTSTAWVVTTPSMAATVTTT